MPSVNLQIAGAIALAFVVAFLATAVTFYHKGYNAHAAEVAAEITRINKERADLAATLAAERLQAGARQAQAEQSAIAATQAYCASNPTACGVDIQPAGKGGWRTTVTKPGTMSCAAACSTPTGLRSTLSSIH